MTLRLTILGPFTLQLVLHLKMNSDNNSHVDGDDYEVGGKYRFYMGLLSSIRRDIDLPEDIKARRLETLKSEIIPFWSAASPPPSIFSRRISVTLPSLPF